jgi:hypothetical protein
MPTVLIRRGGFRPFFDDVLQIGQQPTGTNRN